jgi:hypothetical protein
MWSVSLLAALPRGEGVTGTYVIRRVPRAVLVAVERTQSFDLFGGHSLLTCSGIGTQLRCSQVCSLVTVRTGAVILIFIVCFLMGNSPASMPTCVHRPTCL